MKSRRFQVAKLRGISQTRLMQMLVEKIVREERVVRSR